MFSFRDKQLLESILNAINIILFPDLRSDVEEMDSYISEESDVHPSSDVTTHFKKSSVAC